LPESRDEWQSGQAEAWRVAAPSARAAQVVCLDISRPAQPFGKFVPAWPNSSCRAPTSGKDLSDALGKIESDTALNSRLPKLPPGASKFFDVEGIPVAKVGPDSFVAFDLLNDNSRPFPARKAELDGDPLSRHEFIFWLRTGRNKFDVWPSAGKAEAQVGSASIKCRFPKGSTFFDVGDNVAVELPSGERLWAETGKPVEGGSWPPHPPYPPEVLRPPALHPFRAANGCTFATCRCT
jgi:hypothetical protein